MLLLVSPAKALDYETPVPPLPVAVTQPAFLREASELIELLRPLSYTDVASLMNLSDKLASLNVARYASWKLPFTEANARPAIMAFNGDVYDGLNIRSLNADAMRWLQERLRILSGLYGVLRPLDLMQAYRLEMGTRLSNARGKDLYAFWGDRIAQALKDAIAKLKSQAPVLVNLASEEYFKAVSTRLINARIVTPVFEDWKDGRFKIISFYAKRARGLMCRFAAERRCKSVEELRSFDYEGYAFAAEASGENTWVFRRQITEDR